MPATKKAAVDQGVLLEKISLFAGLPAAERQRLEDASRLLSLPAHRILLRNGTPAREIYALVSGAVKRVVPLPTGGEKVVELVYPQQLFGLGEVFGASHYSSYAETLSESVVVGIAAKAFRAAVATCPELAARTIRILAQRQCAIEFETASHHALTGTHRLLDFLVALAGGRLGVAGETVVQLDSSKKLLASRIGMAPETFSRTLRLLVESGTIVVDGRKVYIQNAALALKGHGDEPKAIQGLKRKKPTARLDMPSVAPGWLINLCGKQRMLSQRLATAWAMQRQSIAPMRARLAIKQLSAQFDRNLARLARLKLSGELAAALERLAESWPSYREGLATTASGMPAAERILELSEQVLDAADRMTGAAEVAFGTAAGRRVNVAGRNRMISQRMTKLFMFRGWNVRAKDVLGWMEASRAEFAANLEELRRDDALDPALAEQLKIVAALWQEFNELVRKSGRRHGDIAAIRAVLAASERLLRHVDTTVKLYEYLAG